MSTSPAFLPRYGSRSGGCLRSRRGFTLVESMVSLAVLVVASVGCVFSFMQLNQYAANLRNLSSAKGLCQERIEQANTMTFSPPSIAPLAPGQDGKWYYILGMPSVVPTLPTNASGTAVTTVPASSPQTATDYSTTGTTTGTFTGGSGQTSLSEPVTIYMPRDGTTASAVTGTRTTTVALSPLTDAATTGNPSLRIVQFTVTVAYTYRGQNYSYSMYTLRGPD